MALFEVSWEVANKVGGIYTVVRSKAPFMRTQYPTYVTIGPKFSSSEFEERPVPPHWREVFAACESRGVKCTWGAWLIPGEPDAILIDSNDLVSRKNDIKGWYWEHYRIDSMRSAWEFEEPMCFATAAGIVVEEYARRTKENVICHAHEWIAGFSLLHLRKHAPNVATVFTTHATMLGRTIAGNSQPLYELLDAIVPTEWAYRYNVQDKHLTEVACAQHSHVFTTVSEITGLEAEKLLGRKPDVLVYNGFFAEKFPTFEETSLRHYASRESLRELVAYHFFPYYTFDLEKTVFCFTSGRYEFQNKGMDVLIEALGKLNQRMKDEKSDKTLVAFFWVIMGHEGVRRDVLEQKNHYQHLKSTIEWQSKQLQQRIVLDMIAGHRPGEDDHFTTTFIKELHEDTRRLRREGTPPLSTHIINDRDAMLASCKTNGLLNREEDRVKIIIYPGYLEGTDGLLNLSYYDATVGAHLGIFPSAYEPWGYTPLESVALSVPAITTDLAGFGQYLLSHQLAGEKASKGVFVIKRRGRPRHEFVEALADHTYSFVMMDRSDRIQHGFSAKGVAGFCDWRSFIKQYFLAHAMAIERRT